LLPGQQCEAALLDALPDAVDVFVAGDDPVGERYVGVQQCRGGLAHG
jgi:hypothetical protein